MCTLKRSLVKDIHIYTCITIRYKEYIIIIIKRINNVYRNSVYLCIKWLKPNVGKGFNVHTRCVFVCFCVHKYFFTASHELFLILL